MTLPQAIRTTCAYCGVGCGVLATPDGAGGAAITGDPDHPANMGRLCVKGSSLGETLGLEGRLLQPMLRNATGDLQPSGWDAAITRVASGFAEAIAEHGPDSVALYVSGQLLTEDYYVANKLMKGFVGTANIDTNSRLCMSSAVAGHKRAFGEDIVPVSYADVDEADVVVLVGSNTAWCHPVLFQRILAAKKARPSLQIVVIDPRYTATCELADLHLPLAPGSDVLLFNGLLAWLHQHGVTDPDFVAQHTSGADAALQVALQSSGSTAHVARGCKLPEALLRQFYALWARTDKVITLFSQGVNQSSAGTDKVNAILNCHLLTGRIERPGMGPLSITGQPNAMGGREVGGLANMLAAHLDITNPTHQQLVQGFWQSPRIATQPGLKAVELFEAVKAGRIKALWIMATNPLVSLPNADVVREALAACPLVVVSEVMADTDLTPYAHVQLPALAWGEKDGTVTNSDRTISRQRAFLPAPGVARADWRIVCDVAIAMGFDGFAYPDNASIFAEHAALTAHGNHAPVQGLQAPRVLDLGALAQLNKADYDALTPRRWPCPADGVVPPRLIAQAKLVPVWPRGPVHVPNDDYPLLLNTGRVRDHWHTMTRTGKAPTLASHSPEPTLDIHPHDALLWGVQDGRLVRVRSKWGSAVLRLRTSTSVARRQVFAPIHWNGQTASDARIGAVVNPAVDPISGEPEFKHTPVAIEPFFVQWHGFLLRREPLRREALDGSEDLSWWTRITGSQFTRYELAGRSRLDQPEAWAEQLLGVGEDDDWIALHDASEGLFRAALLQDGQLQAVLLVSPRSNELPTRNWLGSLFAQPTLPEASRRALLSGIAPQAGADPGPTVCSCFSVGENPIRAAIAEGCQTPESLGQKLRCGTNCGSCVPELKQLIAKLRAAQE